MNTKSIFFSALFFAICSISGVTHAEESQKISIDRKTTALLITDPQNDFLHKNGAAYGLVKDNLNTVGTIDNIDALFKTAIQSGMPIFVSPHFYFPQDKKWKHRGALQKTINDINMFHVSHPISQKEFEGSGADFLSRYKKVIYDANTTITSPHKVYGPESNDLVLQLRKQGIQTILIGGMAANLCTDSHMRELVEQGFDVIMVKDAVGAPGDAAYLAALTNYSLIANAVVSTREAIKLMNH